MDVREGCVDKRVKIDFKSWDHWLRKLVGVYVMMTDLGLLHYLPKRFYAGEIILSPLKASHALAWI